MIKEWLNKLFSTITIYVVLEIVMDEYDPKQVKKTKVISVFFRKKEAINFVSFVNGTSNRIFFLDRKPLLWSWQ